MDKTKIEAILEDCQKMASEPVFNLDSGFQPAVNYEKYSSLLEGLLRVYLPKIKNEL